MPKAKLSPSTRAPIADGVSISPGSIQRPKNCILADRNNNGVDVFDTVKETAVGLAGGFVGIQPTSATVVNNSGPNGIFGG